MKFEVDDSIWLKIANICIRHIYKKLDYKKIRSFEITEYISPLVYWLDLSKILSIHDIFHVENLEKTADSIIDDQREYLQDPVEAISDKKGDIETIVDSRSHPQLDFQYKINWIGDYRNTGEPIKNLYYPNKIQTFHASNTDKPKSRARAVRQPIFNNISQAFGISTESLNDDITDSGISEAFQERKTMKGDILL